MGKTLNTIIKKAVSEAIGQVISETSRRQKAVTNFLGKNNNVKTFGIITGENPSGIRMNRQENQKRNNMLKSFLASRQYVFYTAKGKYNSIEHPFIIYNVSIEDMKAIGHTFDQESFIYAEVENENGQPKVIFSYYKKDYSENDKVSADGHKIKPSEREYKFIESKETYIRLDSNLTDEFTAIGRNFKFSIPFDVFKESFERINNFINERCEESDMYDRYHVKLIEESIQNKRTAKSRRLKRAQLYGKNYKMFLDKN